MVSQRQSRNTKNAKMEGYWVLPRYQAHQRINVPPLDKLINITSCQLCELEETMLSDLDDEDKDLAANRYPSPDVDDDDED